MDDTGLDRFLRAQAAGTWEQALAELRAGHKRSHWMWFVLPQLRGLGRSTTAQRYGLAELEEARDYLAHPVLGARLREAVDTLLALDAADAHGVLGAVDALKLRSCLTLFTLADPDDPRFPALLERWYDGERDPHTLRLLGYPA